MTFSQFLTEFGNLGGIFEEEDEYRGVIFLSITKNNRLMTIDIMNYNPKTDSFKRIYVEGTNEHDVTDIHHSYHEFAHVLWDVKKYIG